VESLRKRGYTVAGFFYNPNIHPYSEYLKRKGELERYAKEAALNVAYAGYDIEKYFERVVYDEAMRDRCPVCWWLRSEATARYAKENGFDAFTTTLLGSPYQDHDVIKDICGELARNLRLNFYYEDFSLGFKAAHETARIKGMYCQNYCGCLFSERDRLERHIKK